MISFAVLIIVALQHIQAVTSLGCMPQICKGNEDNKLRGCPDRDDGCGSYLGKRVNGEIVPAVDIECTAGSAVFAPFEGEMYFYRPFGGMQEKSCGDEGARIEGTGYVAHISSIKLEFYGGKVNKSTLIGKAMDSTCHLPTNQRDATPFVQLKNVCPHVYNMILGMCTGQICESNTKNKLIKGSNPFKSDKRFNGVRGWDIECRMMRDDEDAPRAPLIYSPIEGMQIGRTRLAYDASGSYSGCENDGVFIVGSGEWMGFEARIYNVRVRADLEFGRQHIVQGQPIATRLACDEAPDSVFLEVRYEGRVVDVSDVISAKKCQLPDDLQNL